MPELPEVETSRLGVLPHFEGEVVCDVFYSGLNLRYPVSTQVNDQLKGQTGVTIDRRAKYLIMRFSESSLLLHLGMSGHLRVEDSVDFIKKKHDHWALYLKNKALVYHDPRRFGFVVQYDEAWCKKLAQLGPEPLEAGFSSAYLYQQAQKSQRAIKALIMDQAVVVGVGNIYANEALFEIGVHPMAKSNKLSVSDCGRLVVALKTILSDAIKLGGTTLRDFVSGHAQPGYFKQSLKVYGRESAPCVRCQGEVRKLVIQQRASFYCEGCQSLL